MPDSNPSELILAVPGPEQMRAFPKKWIRAAIAKGELRRSQLIWSPIDNEWKQVRQLPHLMPTRVIAPLPIITPRPAVRVMKAGVAARSGTAASAQARAKEKGKLTGKDTTFSVLRVVAVCSFFFLVSILGFNFLLVQAPFSEGLRAHNLSDVPVYANYGGFCQVNILTLHLLPSNEVRKSNIAHLIISIAKSTPHPLNGNLFTLVSITPGWAGGYVFNGVDWSNLRALDEMPELQQKLGILRVVKDPSDNPIIDPQEEAQPLEERTEMTSHEVRVWNSFISSFTP